MDRRLVRRIAPAIYAIAVLIAVLAAKDALIWVVVIGAVLLGLVYSLVSGGPGGRERPGRDRRRR